MKKKWIITGFILMLSLSIFLGGCNKVTRKFGGTQIEELPPGKKLVNITWKVDSLWIVTRDMRPEEKAETYEFQESSTFGILEGTVVIKERVK